MPARARDARRTALLTQARARDAPVLALGHTATDQLETLLMHLTRGAGLDGLSGMPSFDGVLLRPLLALTRAQSAAICTHFDEPVVHDPTNDATDHFRIELRKQVLPRLRAHNPKVEGAAHASAQLVRDADEAIAAWVQRELELRRTVKGQAKGADVTYALRDYQTLPRAIRFGFVRAVLLEAGVDASELRLRVVADIDRALMGDLAKGRGPAPRRWDLPGGYVGHVARAQLWAQKTDPRPVADL